MPNRKLVVVFVHGWSVTNTNTYGGLPARLRNEAPGRGLGIEVRHVFLGRYVSFHDEVRLPDVSRAFQAAVADELGALLASGERFVCITHSTGGPVIRDWWQRYYDSVSGSGPCPMSHLIMLAPANHGSALAQLGKGRLSRLKSWFGGVEPGQGVLDWLELGSRESWDLNTAWIASGDQPIAANGILPFVLTGQTIDRKLYDNLNTYTGELGSDGVVRVAGANLRSRLVRLAQQEPEKTAGSSKLQAPQLELSGIDVGAETALRLVRGASHSGTDKGIMRAVKAEAGHAKGRDQVDAIFECIAIEDKPSYRRLVKAHDEETARIHDEERVETEERLLLSDTHFVHDRYAMVVFRVSDDYGHALQDFDLLLTAGEDNDPNKLPQGFFQDRQRNRLSGNCITYYFNYDIMAGSPEIRAGDKLVRAATPGATALGLRVMPRPEDGFVRYLPCEIRASREMLDQVLRPNETTYVDIRLRRIVSKEVFRLAQLSGDSTAGSFSRVRPGDDIAR